MKFLNDDPLRFAKVMTHDGRDLDPKQTETEYIENIRRCPRRADLRVGYGNLLLFLHRRDEAREQHTKALEIEPLAIEALKALAEMDADEGRLQQALLKIDKCLRLFDHAKMYRIPRGLSRGEVREYLQELREEFIARMGELGLIGSYSAYKD